MFSTFTLIMIFTYANLTSHWREEIMSVLNIILSALYLTDSSFVLLYQRELE